MKLRNKKTGEIKEGVEISIWIHGEGTRDFPSIVDLNEQWEDYKPKEPLIKDEKIRKVARALFDVWEVEDVKIDSNKYFLVTTIEAIGKGWKLEIPNININGVFKPTELCGEEE